MKLFTLLTATASLLIVSACASTPVPTDERVKIETVDVSDVQPGFIYVSPEAADVFTLSNVETEINESGYLAVRVFGKTCELSALKWAFLGDIEYKFGYRFFWFDADGKRIGADAQRVRSTVPGDPVRFVGHAPTEECRSYALILCDGDEVGDSCDASGASDGEAAASAEKDAETQAAEDAEKNSSGESVVVPSLPQENVAGDKHETKVIGVPSESPAAVPADKQ